MSKRPDGTLEHDVLSVLWAAEGPLQPGDVKDRLPYALAYTSVATVLGRLHTKGLVQRVAAGRAFAYAAVVKESELAVQRMNDVLAGASDRGAVLAGFVGKLSKRDVKLLRARLEQGER